MFPHLQLAVRLKYAVLDGADVIVAESKEPVRRHVICREVFVILLVVGFHMCLLVLGQ
jgi:hypothetical protein